MFADKSEIDYRRYTAYTGSIIPGVQKTSSESDEGAAEEKTETKKKPELPVNLRISRLRNKLNDNIDNREKLNEYIKLCVEEGLYEDAHSVVEKYLKRHGSDNHTRYALAVILLRMNKRKEAKIELREILRKNPRFKEARDLLDRMRLGKA
ncbi:tetratricopeptide repeat protein [bacterium]|nr:tetratricopeptide repeat protein [bacterium]